MDIPKKVRDGLAARKITISETPIVQHGKAALTVAYSHVTFNEDFSVATPVFTVVAVERPEPIPRRKKATPKK